MTEVKIICDSFPPCAIQLAVFYKLAISRLNVLLEANYFLIPNHDP